MSETPDNKVSVSFEKSDAVAGIPEELQHQQVGPMIGIAAIALNMAMKYADINTVQDGVLYQQYKMEGKNMQGLHLAYVLSIAKEIEEHLVKGNRRVAALLVAATLDEFEAVEGEVAETAEDGAQAPTATS